MFIFITVFLCVVGAGGLVLSAHLGAKANSNCLNKSYSSYKTYKSIAIISGSSYVGTYLP
jgi:hypothetical protein